MAEIVKFSSRLTILKYFHINHLISLFIYLLNHLTDNHWHTLCARISGRHSEVEIRKICFFASRNYSSRVIAWMVRSSCVL